VTLTIHADAAPLRTDSHGVIRVGNSQVLLDVVVNEFKRGASPKEIVDAYSTLDLASVYAVIAYYLRHQREVDEYLEWRRIEAAALQKEIEASPLGVLHRKLLARKEQMESGNAAASK